MAERPVLTVGQVFELAGCVECDRLAAAWPLPLPATALVKICGPAHNCGATSLGHAQIVKGWTCCPHPPAPRLGSPPWGSLRMLQGAAIGER